MPAELSDTVDLAWTAFRSLPESAVILDRSGRIVAVNKAWTDFAHANGNPSLVGCNVGDDYLRACRSDTGSDLELIRQARAGMKGLLWGAREHLELEYPCDSPTDKRWFRLEAWRIPSDYFFVRHRDITAVRGPGHSLPTSRGQYRELSEEVPKPSLTKRQKEVLEKVGSGESHRRIAADLGISEKTVDYHIKALKEKFGCRRTIAIVRQATEQGLI